MTTESKTTITPAEAQAEMEALGIMCPWTRHHSHFIRRVVAMIFGDEQVLTRDEYKVRRARAMEDIGPPGPDDLPPMILKFPKRA